MSTPTPTTVIKNQGLALSKAFGISKELQEKLALLCEKIQPEMIGEVNPKAAAELPRLIQCSFDIMRIVNSTAKGAKSIGNRLGWLYAGGLTPIWSKTNDEGLAILLEICTVVDAIADAMVGED